MSENLVSRDGFGRPVVLLVICKCNATATKLGTEPNYRITESPNPPPPSLLRWDRLDGDNVSMSVVMAPLWAVDLVIVLAPVVMAIVVAVRRLRHGEPVDAMLVSYQTKNTCL